MTTYKLVFVLSLGLTVSGQTQVDLSKQARKIDFTADASTLPVKLGTMLPGTCQPAELFFKIDASAGANIYGCTGSNIWTAQGGGEVGQVEILDVVYLAPQTLLIGAGCAVENPCNVRFGNTVYSIQNAATVTLSGEGSGQAFVYVSSAGILTVGHTLTVACSSGCVAQTGVSAFPSDAIPLFRWTATAGAWDITGGADFRAFLSSAKTAAGTGLIAVDAGGHTTVAVDTAMVPLRVATPATSASECTTGVWALDSTHFYVCVAVNTWARAGIASW